MLQLTNADKRIKSLCGLPIAMDNFQIFPLKIRDVVNIGESVYNYYLSLVTMIKKVLKSERSFFNIEGLENLTDFQIIYTLSSIQPQFKVELEKAIEFFLNSNYSVSFYQPTMSFLIKEEEEIIYLLNEKNYQDFIENIKLQNYLIQLEKEKDNPADEETKRLLEKRKKTREMIKEVKRKNHSNEPLTLADYISIIASKTNVITIPNILDMTVYAFYDFLERLALLDNYEVSLKQILAGADPKKVEIKHWLSKL